LQQCFHMGAQLFFQFCHANQE